MSSTNRGHNRHKSDYYVTPQDQIELFLNEFLKIENINNDVIILDPCAGGDANNKMSYPCVLEKMFKNSYIQTIDVRSDSLANVKTDYLNYICKDIFDVIITNPPFNIAIDIINKAISDVKPNGFVIMLLRLNFLGSKQRFEFWQNNKPKYIFVHHKRMSFIKNGGTDSVEYAHFVWQKGNKDNTKLFVI